MRPTARSSIPQLQDASLVDVFKQLDVVSIVDMHFDEHRTWCIEGFAEG
jgi:hypothetical protein